MKKAGYVVGVLAIGLWTGWAVAQSQPTPGAPSQPFTPIAQAQNGGAGPRVTYQYGTEFVQVNGSPNSAYPNFSLGGTTPVPRGGVTYDYRISRYEVDGSQWSAFFNAILAVEQQTGQPIPFIATPGGLSQGGVHGRVGNISWRTAAIYCNWLHNDQALTRDAFLNGAYDVSTFGVIGNQYTDQLTHNVDARFWIPTLDEWIRAAHYDPNRNGPGQGGWWQFAISRDTSAIGLLPRQGGEVNAGFVTQTFEEFLLPLGAYSNIQSPWGLFDTTGGSTEWIEEPLYQAGPNLPYSRGHAGAYLTGSPSDIAFGRLSSGAAIGSSVPWDSAYWHGFRIAAAIPAPGTSALLSLALWQTIFRKSRRVAPRMYSNK